MNVKGLKLEDFEDLRVEFDRIIKDEKTTEDNLVYIWDYFKGFSFIADNEIKMRLLKGSLSP